MSGLFTEGFILGLSLGTLCLALCSPILLPLVLALPPRGAEGEEGPRRRFSRPALFAALQFLLGRAIGYALFGLAVGAISERYLDIEARKPVGVALLVVAVLMALHALGVHPGGSKVCGALGRLTRRIRAPLLLGLFTGVNICPPFLAAMVLAVKAGGAGGAVVAFAGFFLGTSVYFVPFLLVPTLGLVLPVERLRKLAQVAAVLAVVLFLRQGIDHLAGRGGPLEVEVTAADLRRLLPEARRFEPVPGEPSCRAAFRSAAGSPGAAEKPFAFVMVSIAVTGGEIEGYAGPVPVLVALDRAGKVLAVGLLPNEETPAYADSVGRAEFLDRFRGRSFTESFAPGEGGIDGITGATETVDAVRAEVRAAARALAAGPLGLELPREERESKWAALLVPGPWILLALAVFAALAYLRGWTRARLPVLLASVALLGIACKTFFSVADLGRALGGDAPGWPEGFSWLLIIGTVAAATLVFGRLYCGWLCPFGALQEILSRVARALTGRRADAPPPTFDRRARYIKYAVLLAVLVLFLATGSLTAFVAEPFAPAFAALSSSGALARLAGGAGLLLALAALALLSTLLIERLWCRYLCPAGAAMAFIARARLTAPRGCARTGATIAGEDEPVEPLGCARGAGGAEECLNCARVRSLPLPPAGAEAPTPGGRTSPVPPPLRKLAPLAAALLVVLAVVVTAGEHRGESKPQRRRLAEPITLAEVKREALSMREALYWRRLEGQDVICDLCPQHCELSPGERGRCKVRWNDRGTLRTLVYGRLVSANVDPIEKKPVFHLLPGTGAFSIATAGCSLGCIHCQNWGISQAYPEKLRHMKASPEEVVAAALRYRCRSIAYTYNEPSVFYEFMLETAKLAREKGIKNIWVTCGYLNPEPLREFAGYLDAANVDLKGFSEKFYQEYCAGSLAPVLQTLRILREEGVFFEITNLLIPGANDDEEMIREMCRWIVSELGPDVPLHFSRYRPAYRLNRPRTPLSTLRLAARIAREEGLRYVYLGNAEPGKGETTFCPNEKCGRELIVRHGYIVLRNSLRDGRCPDCGAKVPGVWE